MDRASYLASGWEYSRERPNHCSRITHDFAPFLPSFDENAFRVFLPNFNHPLHTYRISSNGDFHEDIIRDTAELEKILERERSKQSKAIFYFFQQKSPRGRFQVTTETCRKIMHTHRVFPPFLDCIFGFGYRTEEDSRVWDGFHAPRIPDPVSPSYELCYTFRYFAKNLENPEDPWSLRQIGIYQRTQFDNSNATWILLEPSSQITSEIRKSFEHEIQCRSDCGTDPLQLHVLFLSLCLQDFGEYIEYLQATIKKMRHKAWESKIGSKLHDFSVSVEDLQNLQRVKHKLITAYHVIRGSHDTLIQLQKHCEEVNKIRLGTVRREVCDSFERYINQCSVYERRVNAALPKVDSIDGLLSRILDSRKDIARLQESAAMSQNLDILRQITSQNAEDNRDLTQIATLNQKDSRVLKALTIVASLYLPASLIATLFSSSLLQIQTQSQTSSESPGPTHIVVAKEVWIYFLATIILTSLTFLPMYLYFFGKRHKTHNDKGSLPMRKLPEP